jgi:hypothetical protein
MPARTRTEIELVDEDSCPEEFVTLIKETKEGLSLYRPELCEEGSNGTYFFFRKNGTKCAVFKPVDEEGDFGNNPKSKRNKLGLAVEKRLLSPLSSPKTPNSRRVMEIGIGEAAKREAAAYLLDREQNWFYGVPPTVMVKITCAGFGPAGSPGGRTQTKIGSLQAFVHSDGCAEDISPSLFPVREVHKIGLLDLQLVNTDRTDPNILYQRSRENPRVFRLVPIDHGFSLPPSFQYVWFGWMSWPQAKQPFDASTKNFIEKMDPDRDARLLRGNLSIPDDCLRVMKTSVTLLKRAAAADLTLYDIGSLMSRMGTGSDLSEIERMCETAVAKAGLKSMRCLSRAEEDRFFKELIPLMDRAIEPLRKTKPGLSKPKKESSKSEVEPGLDMRESCGVSKKKDTDDTERKEMCDTGDGCSSRSFKVGRKRGVFRITELAL